MSSDYFAIIAETSRLRGAFLNCNIPSRREPPDDLRGLGGADAVRVTGGLGIVPSATGPA